MTFIKTFLKEYYPFKLTNPPYVMGTPVHEVELEEGVLGRADKNGNILINKNITDPKQRKDVIRHEEVHIEQLKSGELDYDAENVYYKGKTYPRSTFHEGNSNLPWEKPANNKKNGKRK
tara:strand:- start:166 stop:522 length:357 start_codon:yes stop_codon:yes gene_type:complete